MNTRAVKRLAASCADGKATLVHLSTNYILGGEGDRAYSERDTPRPRSVYVISRLAGEHAATAYLSKGGNFVQRMLARAREQGSAP